MFAPITVKITYTNDRSVPYPKYLNLETLKASRSWLKGYMESRIRDIKPWDLVSMQRDILKLESEINKRENKK
jgi:hypothetical protein